MQSFYTTIMLVISMLVDLKKLTDFRRRGAVAGCMYLRYTIFMELQV